MLEKTTLSIPNNTAVYTTPVQPKIASEDNGYAMIFVSGTFAMNIVIQWCHDGGTTWHTQSTVTAPGVTVLLTPVEGILLRVGCAGAAEYTSGTATIAVVC